MKNVSQKMLDPKRVSEIYSVPTGTLGQWRSLKKGPKFYKLPGGRKVLYSVQDCDSFFLSTPILTSESVKADG